MKIALSGAGGLVGSALVPRLRAAGHEVLRLVRRLPRRDDEVAWRPEGSDFRETLPDPAALGGLDALVHLAGENIAGRRWSPEQKQRLEHSRVQATRDLCSALLALEIRPAVLLCASAIGFYGDRGGRELDETAERGAGFLAELCERWEAATEVARMAGVRVVNLRFGMILARRGGALRKLLPPFRLGLGGRLGSGRQWVSWIALDDALGAIQHCLERAELHGPVNAVAPAAVTNAELARVLGRVLSRPAVLPAPAFALRLALGELADELLLSSQRVLPRALLESGFEFELPGLEDALRHLLDG